MGTWYWIGVSVGIGAAVGVLCAAFARKGRLAELLLLIVAMGAGYGLGRAVGAWQSGGWGDEVGGMAAAIAASLGASQVVLGALRRGGARSGTVVLVAGAALVVAGAAFIPAAGYLEALAIPALGGLLLRKRPERYAGLRTLAKD